MRLGVGSSRGCHASQISYAHALQLVQFLDEPRSIPAWIIHSQIHSLPEVGPYKIIRMSLQHELAILDGHKIGRRSGAIRRSECGILWNCFGKTRRDDDGKSEKDDPYKNYFLVHLRFCSQD